MNLATQIFSLCEPFGRLFGLVLCLFALPGHCFIGTAHAPEAIGSSGRLETLDQSVEMQVFLDLVTSTRDMAFEELLSRQVEPRTLVTRLHHDPVEAKHFERIRSKLKLTDEELRLFAQQGFVSIDHQQKSSFGSVYYQIYSSHLPVFVTSDSILHGIHRSFDTFLSELESNEIKPLLETILREAHSSLAGEEQAQGLLDTYRDVDLYLCVARNLLGSDRSPARTDPSPHGLRFPSVFGQDKQIKAILDLIDAGKTQIPDEEVTQIYGGRRAVDYSQFLPRGHYTKSRELKAYFRCMMWLSRADCGWFIQPADPVTRIRNDSIRELRNACLLTMSLKSSGQLENFEAVNTILSRFASRDDCLSAGALFDLLTESGIAQISDLQDDSLVAKLQLLLEDTSVGKQLIRSQAIFVDGVSYTVPPPSLFQLFGQKFLIDSFAMSNMVYDSIIYENTKVKRYMPMGLDVMAALGNDTALHLLEPELRAYRYSSNLWATSQVIDACTTDFWESDAYNRWIDTIRELDYDVYSETHLPECMKTAAWQRKQLQTQLASWSELRHDMVLYGKQSYTGVPGCAFMDAYVEPYPKVYDKLGRFVEVLRTAVLELPGIDLDDDAATRRRSVSRERQLAWAVRAKTILEKLEAIAEAEVRGDDLSAEQLLFLQQTIDRRGSLPHGSGSRPRYDGWYCDLFYEIDDVKKWEPTITDVHTFPDPHGVPRALQVGIGNVQFGIISVDHNGTSTAYVGPLYSYYEFSHPTSDRLTDEAWSKLLEASASGAPRKGNGIARPEWTHAFHAPPLSRTIDKNAAFVSEGKIQLMFAKDNEVARTEVFPATNEGVQQFINFVEENGLQERWSLNLASANVTPEIVTELHRLDGLVFVSLPQAIVDNPLVQQFRNARADIEVHPPVFQLSYIQLCEDVQAYRTWRPLSKDGIKPGDSFRIYLELEGATIRSSDFGKKFETNVDVTVRLVNQSGQILQEQLFSDLQNSEPDSPRHVYRHPEFVVANSIPAGDYQLKIEISDRLKYPRQSTFGSHPLTVQPRDNDE